MLGGLSAPSAAPTPADAAAAPAVATAAASSSEMESSVGTTRGSRSLGASLDVTSQRRDTHCALRRDAHRARRAACRARRAARPLSGALRARVAAALAAG